VVTAAVGGIEMDKNEALEIREAETRLLIDELAGLYDRVNSIESELEFRTRNPIKLESKNQIAEIEDLIEE